MKYHQAQQRVKDLKSFYTNLIWFFIVGTLIFFNQVFENGEFNLSLFQGSIILVIWAIVLVVKAVKLFVLNANWENRIIEKEIKKYHS